MKNQLTIYDVFDIKNPNEPLKMPKYNKELLKGIKGITEILDLIPKYKVTFKNPVYGNYKQKICIFMGWWHSLDGWNYDNKNIESYEEVNYKKGEQYRWEQ